MPQESETWAKFEEKLHHLNPGLTKMMYFRASHPLKQNYDAFMRRQKLQFLEKKRIETSRNVSIQAAALQHAQPILIISWTGNHYEPVEIKNRHPS